MNRRGFVEHAQAINPHPVVVSKFLITDCKKDDLLNVNADEDRFNKCGFTIFLDLLKFGSIFEIGSDISRLFPESRVFKDPSDLKVGKGTF